ncbi:MAG: DUF134 domain-containing protein [candidate division Zixibacteria bacterium]|nr:DUF134 domain-containing protein [candidate division Zixibacteria bacterium]
MPRPRKQRCCRRYHADRVYKPRGIPMRADEVVEISLDQFEALRLCDSEGLEQGEAGERMGVSRGTIQRLLYGARKAVIDAIVDNRALVINLKESEACDVVLHPHQRKRRAR